MENVRKVVNPVSSMSHDFFKSVFRFSLPKEYIKSAYLLSHNKLLSQVLIYKKPQPRSKQTEEIKIHKLEVVHFAT